MYIISILSQKGGVGKSSLAQLVSIGYGNNDHAVLLADMDHLQKSSVLWNDIRNEKGLKPVITVNAYRKPIEAIKFADGRFDLLVFDAPPHGTDRTLEMAKASNLIIIPTGPSRFDMEPNVKLANELVKSGIPRNRIVFFFNRMGTSEVERRNAYNYMSEAQYPVLKCFLEDKTGYRYAAESGLSFSDSSSSSLRAKSLELFINISTTVNKLSS